MGGKYQTVTVMQAKASQGYWQLFQNTYRDRAARVIQRFWREKKQCHPREELTNNARLLRFIQEEKDNTSHHHYAALIQSNNWLCLNFEEPDFERHLARALREGLITVNDYATANLLCQAKKDLGGLVNQYTFDDPKGPYQLTAIRYSTQASRAEFLRQLAARPKHEQPYFTIDFSRVREAIFFYDCLKYPKILARQKFKALFKLMIMRSKFSTENEKLYLKSLEDIHSENKGEKTFAFQMLFSMLQLKYKDCHHYFIYHYELVDEGVFQDERIVSYHCAYIKNAVYKLSDIDELLQSQGLLSAIYATKPQCPLVVLSPHFDQNVPQSPLIAMTLASAPAYELMLEIINGAECLTHPYYVVGEFGPRLIRALDEAPHLFQRETSCRPVELTHPDVAYNRAPHKYEPITPFMLTLHDLNHTWLSSLIVDKPLIRYLRQLFQTVTGFEMSVPIWQLTDMDFSVYDYLKTHEAVDPLLKRHFHRILVISTILTRVGKAFWTALEDHDVNLMLLIDMIKHQKRWENEFLLGYSLDTVFTLDASHCWQLDLAIDVKNDYRDSFVSEATNAFKETYQTCREIILLEGRLEKNLSMAFYIVAYRLREHPEAAVITRHLEKIDLTQYLRWDRQSNLICELSGSQYHLQDLTPQSLAMLAKQWIGDFHADTPKPTEARRSRSGFCALS